MGDRRLSRRDGSEPTVSRRRVLGTTALTAAGAGSLLAGVAPAAAATTNFGAVSVGSSRTRTITAENPVGRPVEVTELTITGSDATAFDIVGGDAPFTLGPTESHTVRIEFAPTSTGEKTAEVRVETATRSTVAGQLAGRGVEEGAASAAGEEESESDSSGSDESDGSDGSSEGETTAEESSESDSGEESAGDDTAEDSSTEGSTGSNGSDGSGEDTSDDESSTERTTANDSVESEKEEDRSADGATTTPAGRSGSSQSSRSATDDSDSSSATDSMIGDSPDDPGALLTELLDVNDDGVVNLRDLLRIVRRLG